MQDTVTRWLAGLSSERDRAYLRAILNPIADRMSTQVFSSPGLVIKAGGSALAKAGTTFNAIVQGKLVRVAANTDQAALSGTVVNATFNVFCFFLDRSGTGTTAMGTAGANRAAIVWPDVPEGRAMIGFVLINPTGTGNFVGGTTALDDATVVPNAEYVNTLGAFDPSIVLG